jgi:hypothetical protein
LVAGGIVLAIAALVAAWIWWPRSEEPQPPVSASDDPRVNYTGPFLNVRPEVKYVGDAVCAECHADLAAVYAKHPMAQAMAVVSQATEIEKFDAAARNPFSAGDLIYEVRRQGTRVFHRERAGKSEAPTASIQEEIHYAMGSGAKARSYIVNRDGYLFQSPVTWFVAGQRWDLSPSYEIRNRHFTRTVNPGCLFCHCNFADSVPGTANRYREPIFHGLGIGCERCHGPGELHAVARGREKLPDGAADYTIVNPARLEHHLREAVCQQCHVQGEERVVARGRSDWDFRPGLPLHEFLMDFVDAKDARGGQKFVSSVEQMMASRCYQESREPKKMGCTTCHDPHRTPENETAKVVHYRTRCLTCHTEQSCSAPAATRREQQKDDSCIACHMPQTGSEVNHSAITNHQIPRKASKERTGPAHPPTPGPFDLVPFHRHLIAADDLAVERNLGLARMAMLNRGMPRNVEREYAAAALPLLLEATERDPSDWPAVEAKGHALWLLDRVEEAQACYAASVAANPNRERTRLGAGRLALDTNRLADARAHLEEAIRLNPWQSQYHHELARAYFRLGDWSRAAEACRQALKLEPFSATRSLLIQTYLWDGREKSALAELEVLRRLTTPEKQADLDRWYREEKARAAGGK